MKNNLTILLGLLTALPVFPADAHLKYVVIVTRHGVRAPTWEPQRLNEFSRQPWPDFGVPPGNLTPHGRRAIELMGAYYRRWLSNETLLHSTGCVDKGRVSIYADKDQRTLETGRALAETLLPGCGLTIESQPGAGSDPLFAGSFKADPEESARAIGARTDPQLLARHREAFETLQAILGSGQNKLLDPAADVVKGTFATGSTLSENLLLEYANGMKNPGWGRLTASNLLQVMAIHTTYADLTRRTPYLARRGSNLLEKILHSIEHPSGAVLVISGHDTNLSNLSGLLGLHWELPGYQPDDAPPGGALIFSVWHQASGDVVKLRYVAQSMDQIRTLSSETPLSQDIPLPGCDPCLMQTFQSIVQSRLR